MSNSMIYRGYTASMTFDPDDKVIVGRVLDVDDIIAFHGESVAEFESNFHTVVDDYIAACERLGALPEKPASGKLMLRIAPEVHAAALRAAAHRGVSLNKWAEHALTVATRRGARGGQPVTESGAPVGRVVRRRVAGSATRSAAGGSRGGTD